MTRLLRAAACLVVASLLACGRGSPEGVAVQFARYVIAGDAVSAEGLLTDEERPIADSLRHTKDDGLLATEPSLAVTVDSAHIGRRANDTAYVAVFYTLPNLEGVSDSVVLASARDVEYLKTRPRRIDYDTVRVVRDNGRWRVTIDARFRVGFGPLWDALYDADSTLSARVVVGSKLLDYFRSFYRTPTSYAEQAVQDARDAAGYQDSLEIRGRVTSNTLTPRSLGSYWLEGSIRNRGGRAIKRLSFAATLSTGETRMLGAYDIPAYGSDTFVELRLHEYGPVSFRIVSINFVDR